MTAKKDLKKSKSKKKVKKYNKVDRRSNTEAVETGSNRRRKKGLFGNFSNKAVNDSNIAILSLIESVVLLVLIVLLIFVKPGKPFGETVIAQNEMLVKLVFNGAVKYGLIVVIAVCFGIFAYGYKKNPDYKSFYTSGMTFLGVEILFLITQNMKHFYLFGYGIIIVIAMTIIEMLKFYFMTKYLKRVSDKLVGQK